MGKLPLYTHTHTHTANDRMHMASERTTGWIQEMERGEEEGILNRSWLQIEKFLFLKQSCYVFFLSGHARTEKFCLAGG